MIDTVKFLIPITDSKLIHRLKGMLMRFRKEDLKDGRVHFEFFVSNIELGSYNRTVAIKSTDDPKGFFVEFSAPKYEKGNNVEMIHPHDLLSIVEKLYKEICEYMEYTLPHFSEWPIYRLDVCYNWLFKNKDETSYVIDLIKRIDYPKKKKLTYPTSVMYMGTAYTIKFYLKGGEFRKHDYKKVRPEQAEHLQNWADHIVRFEVNLKRVYLQKYLGVKKVFLHHITNDSVILEMLQTYLKKVFFYVDKKLLTTSQISEVLFSNFNKTKATRLYEFYKGYYLDEEVKNMYLRGGLDRSTIYRYKRDLLKVGVGLSLENISSNETILEQLTIPSNNAKFDLFDYPPSEV